MATKAFYNGGLVCSIITFICMFIAFATPFWYQSWRRVHSSFGNIGLWHVCLNGYIMPRDPVMKSYVGCWWIHSSEFEKVTNQIQPVWFRFIQAFSVFAIILDFVSVLLIASYQFESMRVRFYQKRPRTFFIGSACMLASSFLVFLIALVFAEKSLDSEWMPRPWMNYLSWSYGLCVLSGFFAAFGGMCFFILALVFKDKEDNGDPGVISAAELNAKRKALEKQDEMVRQQGAVQMDHMKSSQYGSGSVAGRPGYYGSGPVHHRPMGSGPIRPGGHHGSGQIRFGAPQQHPASVHAPHHGSGQIRSGAPHAPPPAYGSVSSMGSSRPGGYAHRAAHLDRPSGPPSIAESQGSHAPESAV